MPQYEGEAAAADVSVSSLYPAGGLPSVHVALFELGSLRFALPIACIDELTQAFAIEPLPNAPNVVAGAANLRGRILPVFDLRRRFGLEHKPLEASDHFVVARAGERRVILRVDRALELRSLEISAIGSLLDLPPAAALLAGAANVEDGVLFVYDLGSLLDESERLSLDAALLAPRPEHAA